MTIRLDYEQMARIVVTTCDFAESGAADEQIALFWTVRNHLRQVPRGTARDVVSEVCEMLRDTARCGLGPTAGDPRGSFEDPFYCRAFGLLCGVLSSDIPDPTGGALRFHRHDRVPGWSRLLQPSALIGRYFFYDDCSLRTSSHARPRTCASERL